MFLRPHQQVIRPVLNSCLDNTLYRFIIEKVQDVPERAILHFSEYNNFCALQKIRSEILHKSSLFLKIYRYCAEQAESLADEAVRTDLRCEQAPSAQQIFMGL